MSVKNALLALVTSGPAHGYQLKAEFDEATGSAWPLNFGQVYTSLQRLQDSGLLQSHGEDDDGRIMYSITTEGQDQVQEWLGSPAPQPLASRDELSMKVLIAVATDIIDPVKVLSAQRTAAMSTLQSITRLKGEVEDKDLAWRLHLDRASLITEAEIRWLDLVEERLRAANGTAASGDTVTPGDTATSDEATADKTTTVSKSTTDQESPMSRGHRA
jgi:DNA-binding PadR family transcriptional regulator